MYEQIEFQVLRYDLAITVELLADLAPNTVAALTAALPTAGLVTCEDRYGSVVCLRLPNISRPLPVENATIFPSPGDVFIFEREHGLEIVVFYERLGGVPAGVPFDSIGAKAGNRIGIVGNIRSSPIPAAARRIWREGAAWGAMAPVGTTMMQSFRDDRAAATAEIARRLLDWRRRTGRDHLGPVPGVGRRVALRIPEFGVQTEVEPVELWVSYNKKWHYVREKPVRRALAKPGDPSLSVESRLQRSIRASTRNHGLLTSVR